MLDVTVGSDVDGLRRRLSLKVESQAVMSSPPVVGLDVRGGKMSCIAELLNNAKTRSCDSGYLLELLEISFVSARTFFSDAFLFAHFPRFDVEPSS